LGSKIEKCKQFSSAAGFWTFEQVYSSLVWSSLIRGGRRAGVVGQAGSWLANSSIDYGFKKCYMLLGCVHGYRRAFPGIIQVVPMGNHTVERSGKFVSQSRVLGRQAGPALACECPCSGKLLKETLVGQSIPQYQESISPDSPTLQRWYCSMSPSCTPSAVLVIQRVALPHLSRW
jgi:hypothetical protein